MRREDHDKMTDVQEMTIPVSHGERRWELSISMIVVVFVALAIWNLSQGTAIVASCLWLAIVGVGVWTACADAKGIRNFTADRLATLSRRRFARVAGHEIEFTARLFGMHILQKRIDCERIRSVEWSPGQATSLAGRDMNDWSVCLWYDHQDKLATEKRRKWSKRPEQDVYTVGPSRRRDDTAAFGNQFVGFLRRAGVALSQIDRNSFEVNGNTKAHPTSAGR